MLDTGQPLEPGQPAEPVRVGRGLDEIALDEAEGAKEVLAHEPEPNIDEWFRRRWDGEPTLELEGHPITLRDLLYQDLKKRPPGFYTTRIDVCNLSYVIIEPAMLPISTISTFFTPKPPKVPLILFFGFFV